MRLKLKNPNGVDLIIYSHINGNRIEFYFEIANAGTSITLENAVILLKYIVESLAEADRAKQAEFIPF